MDMNHELRDAYIDEEEHDANEGALWNVGRHRRPGELLCVDARRVVLGARRG